LSNTDVELSPGIACPDFRLSSAAPQAQRYAQPTVDASNAKLPDWLRVIGQ